MVKKNKHSQPTSKKCDHNDSLDRSSHQELPETSAFGGRRAFSPASALASRAKPTSFSSSSSDDEERPMKAPTRANSLRFQRQEEERYEQLQMKNAATVQSVESSKSCSVVSNIVEVLHYDHNSMMQKSAIMKSHDAPRLMLDNERGVQHLRYDERSQTSSTVPPPPVLQQQSHFSQPGAFRMSVGGRPQSTSLDSVENTSIPMSLQQAPEVLESEVDHECPTIPTPMDFATSMGAYVTATTAVTANRMSVVEAEPIHKHTLRDFFDNGKVKCVICLLLSFLILLVLGAAYWLVGFNMNEFSSGNDFVEATVAPVSPTDLDLKFFTRVAIPEYSRSALRKANSPQSKALAWLKNNTLLEAYPLNRRLQRYSLATLYFATGGDRRWRLADGWLSELDECGNWYTTSAAGTFPCNEGILTELSLRDMNLVGNIPDEIGLLSALKIIELSQNQITGTIPRSLAGMFALEEILLFDNYLSGEIPASIKTLKELEIIDFGFNFLAGTVPPIGQLTNLRHIHLDRNLLSSDLPASIGKLSKLESLHLFGNAFEGTLDELSMSFNRMGSITHLAIDRNRLSGTLPPSLSLLTNLRSLTLGNNTFASTIPVDLYKGCTELEVLDIFDNSLSGSLASEVYLLTNLRALFMEGNRLFGTLPSEIGNLQDLEVLWLHNNDFHGKMPTEFGRLRRLRDVKVHGNLLTGEVPKKVCDLVDMGLLPAYNFTVDCSLMECSCCKTCLTSEIQSMANPSSDHHYFIR